jgi:hypothetical protein
MSRGDFQSRESASHPLHARILGGAEVVKCIGCLRSVVMFTVQVRIGNEDFLIYFVNSTCCVMLQTG